MRCPFCGNVETQVKDSRISDDGESVKRRRYFAACDSRFKTFEKAAGFQKFIKIVVK